MGKKLLTGSQLPVSLLSYNWATVGSGDFLMQYKIVIPASAILAQKDNILRLDHPGSCSRCDRTPAALFETHQLRVRAGLKPNPLPGIRYKLNHNYKLRIPLCERCYQQDYLQSPETLAGDDTRLGRLSGMQNFLRMLGSLSAAIGILLLTPLVPAVGFLAVLKTGWWVNVTAGLVLVLTALLSQTIAKKSLLKVLENAGDFNQELVRADIRTPLFSDPADLSQVALEIRMNNVEWARQCATHFQFGFDEIKSK